MFNKKRCRNCGNNVKDDWRFCPYCGEYLKKDIFERFLPFKHFEEIEKEIDEELKRLDKMFKISFDIPKAKIKPKEFSGISITIKTETGKKPKIDVKTFGEYKKLEPEIRKKLMVYEGGEEKVKPPKITEEPETEITKNKNKQIIKIKLPGVKSINDIEIKKLEQSIEIKAFAGDKLYFKLLPIIGTITKKEFKDETLLLEIER
jgi:HSP20 family molecular chaperone IbpA